MATVSTPTQIARMRGRSSRFRGRDERRRRRCPPTRLIFGEKRYFYAHALSRAVVGVFCFTVRWLVGTAAVRRLVVVLLTLLPASTASRQVSGIARLYSGRAWSGSGGRGELVRGIVCSSVILQPRVVANRVTTPTSCKF